MRVRVVTPLLFAAVLFVALDAGATSGTAFGESSRVAALAGAAVAPPGDSGSMLENPAGLGDVKEPELLLGASVARLRLGFGRDGEAGSERTRTIGGFGLAVATPLPGPEWLARLRLGIALYLPADRALRVAVDEREDRPLSPVYDGRPDRMSALGALGYAFGKELRVGLGVVMAPNLATPTEVSYDADRADGVEKDVMVRLDRDLEMSLSPFFGVRAEPLEMLSLGVAYRAHAVSRAGGSQRTVAGGILADDPIDYYQFWDPARLSAGFALGPWHGARLSFQATHARWSEFRTGMNRSLEPAFDDTLELGGGLEWQALPWLVARGGFRHEPSPIPPQTGPTNYLGADTEELSLGAGADFRKLFRAPLALDVHARTRLSAEQSADKDPERLGDASASLPGQQIDNLGYPGFRSSASYWQVGFSLKIFIGKERKP